MDAIKEIREDSSRYFNLETFRHKTHIPRSTVTDALLDDVADDRTLDAWADVGGMARRTFMRAFSAQAGMPFGRWRQQAR